MPNNQSPACSIVSIVFRSVLCCLVLSVSLSIPVGLENRRYYSIGDYHPSSVANAKKKSSGIATAKSFPNADLTSTVVGGEGFGPPTLTV